MPPKKVKLYDMRFIKCIFEYFFWIKQYTLWKNYCSFTELSSNYVTGTPGCEFPLISSFYMAQKWKRMLEQVEARFSKTPVSPTSWYSNLIIIIHSHWLWTVLNDTLWWVAYSKNDSGPVLAGSLWQGLGLTWPGLLQGGLFMKNFQSLPDKMDKQEWSSDPQFRKESNWPTAAQVSTKQPSLQTEEQAHTPREKPSSPCLVRALVLQHQVSCLQSINTQKSEPVNVVSSIYRNTSQYKTKMYFAEHGHFSMV